MDITPYLTGLAGFFLGMLVWSRVLRWVFSIVAVAQEQRRDPVHRSKWRLMPVLFLHSGTWMLMAFLVLISVGARTMHGPGWNGFMTGAYLSPIFTLLIMLWTWRRIQSRRKRAKPAP